MMTTAVIGTVISNASRMHGDAGSGWWKGGMMI
jgi:hypothetical protein